MSKPKLTPAQLATLRHLCGRDWRNTGPAYAAQYPWRGGWYWLTDDDQQVTRQVNSLLDAGLLEKRVEGSIPYAYATPAAHALLAEIDGK